MTTFPSNPIRPDHPTLSSMLLDNVKQMDPEGWSRLVTVFGPVVYRWCRASGVAESDAADLVQDVFVTVARGIGGFERQKSEGSFRSWLATITRSRVRDFYRKQGKRELAAGGTEALHQMHQEPDPLLDSTICPESAEPPVNRQALESVRAEFEPKTWQAFWLTAVEGRTASEAATATGISTASVYQAKSRILRRLRQRLAELPE